MFLDLPNAKLLFNMNASCGDWTLLWEKKVLETDVNLGYSRLSRLAVKDFLRTCIINQYNTPIFLKREGGVRTEPERLEFVPFPTTVYVVALEQKPQRSQISCAYPD